MSLDSGGGGHGDPMPRPASFGDSGAVVGAARFVGLLARARGGSRGMHWGVASGHCERRRSFLRGGQRREPGAQARGMCE